MRDIKNKPKDIKTNSLRIKTGSSLRQNKTGIAVNTVDTLKQQYLKSKAELKKQTDEQTERPENYAVDEIEDKTEKIACSASDTAKRYTKNVKKKLYQNKSNMVGNVNDTPVSDNPTQGAEYIWREATKIEHNETKTNNKQRVKAQNDAAVKAKEKSAAIKTKKAVLSENSQKGITEQPKIKSRQQAAVKNMNGSITEKPSNLSTEQAVKIKSRAKYIKNKTVTENKVYRLKQNRIYHSKDNLTKPKTVQAVRAKQEEKRLNTANDKSKAAREYVRSKLKYKAEFQRLTASMEIPQAEGVQISSNITVHEKAASAENNIKPKQKLVPEEQIKVKRTDIKTKDCYIRSHYKGMSDIKSKLTTPESQRIISQEKQLIKSKPKNVIKSTGDSSVIKRSGETRLHKNYKPRKTAKRTALKTQKQVTKQAAKQAAKKARDMARVTVKTAKIAGKALIRLAAVAAKAIAAAAKTVVSAIAALGGGAVLLVVLIVVIIIAAIAASPFGIFISEEVNETGSIPLSQIISEYNIELTQEVEDIELSEEHTEAEIIDNRTDNNIVIAVFAAKTAGAEDDTAEDVVIFDEAKAEKLKGYFRTANTVEYNITETSISNGEATTDETYLTITITGKTKEELMDEYELTEKQREAVETLLEHGDVITSSSHSLAITNADVQSIIEELPDSLPQERKDVVKNAGSLVGKVNYFWGGKSSAIGWDSAWGTMRRVTAEGSPSSGTLRAYGLDCSGFVSWVFLNSGMSGVGDGTIGQRDRSRIVSETAVQAGDLAFLPSYSHVGIVVGKDTDGNILVIHCSSSANNVVVSTAQSVGFTVFRSPNCY